MNTVFIYALVDPRDDTVRYVGKSVNPKARLIAHIGEARRGLKTHRHNWIRSLLAKGFRPDLLTLEGISEDEWEEAEKKWIAEYSNLVNGTEGAQAPPPYQHTSESRKRIGDFFRGKSISEEHKKRISEGKKRAPHPLRGKKLSAEYREKISQSLKGRKLSQREVEILRKRMTGNGNPNYGKEFSEEHKEKLAKAQKGRKHSAETRAKMATARKKFYEDPDNRKKTSDAMKGNQNRKKT